MAKLTVRNVGPIREAELEVKKHTVFIGPQGTGKSTLAKLVAISNDSSITKGSNTLLDKYGMKGYLCKSSFVELLGKGYNFTYSKEDFNYYLTDKTASDSLTSRLENTSHSIEMLQRKLDEVISILKEQTDSVSSSKKLLNKAEKLVQQYEEQVSFIHEPLKNSYVGIDNIYIPAERTLVSILSNSIWSIINHDISLPKIVKNFAELYAQSINTKGEFYIPFLDVSYTHKQGSSKILQKKKYTDLEYSASGYQSLIPLILVIDNLRRKLTYRYIVEEPELNLYPTAQKDLIYSLMGGLQPDVSYQDAEWVITTHSPYVLSSFNTLMLAYKIGNQSDELRAEVEKIIPSRCWINPDEFAAYYVDNGTVRSIVSEQTGMIADNELDDVSEDLADEQDQLLALRRSITRA